jgi:hypothetical protein
LKDLCFFSKENCRTDCDYAVKNRWNGLRHDNEPDCGCGSDKDDEESN